MKPAHARMLAFGFVDVIAAGGMWDLRNRGEREARILRQGQINSCEAGNDTRENIKSFILRTVTPPDPNSYAYIADPKLRAGVIAQATERYQNTKRDTEEAFKPRDCGALFPKEE
jgi:hypothetical protein